MCLCVRRRVCVSMPIDKIVRWDTTGFHEKISSTWPWAELEKVTFSELQVPVSSQPASSIHTALMVRLVLQNSMVVMLWLQKEPYVNPTNWMYAPEIPQPPGMHNESGYENKWFSFEKSAHNPSFSSTTFENIWGRKEPSHVASSTRQR